MRAYLQTFGELVVNLWHYCTSSEKSLIDFAFDMYSNDELIMTTDEVELMIEDIFHGREKSKSGLKHP